MKTPLVRALALALILLAAAALARLARSAGLADADTVRRAGQVLIGLALCAWANLMPKQLGPARASPRAEAATQAVLRTGGRVLVLGGLAYAAVWALAPLAVAGVAGLGVVAVATAVFLGHALLATIACRRAAA